MRLARQPRGQGLGGRGRGARGSAAAPLYSPRTPMLSVVLPKGSLERATLDLFDAADLTVRRSSDRDYHASIDDPRIDKVRFLRPQEIPSYLERGLFDLAGDPVLPRARAVRPRHHRPRLDQR